MSKKLLLITPSGSAHVSSAHGVVFSQGYGWGGGRVASRVDSPCEMPEDACQENFNEIMKGDQSGHCTSLFGLQKIPHFYYDFFGTS